MKWFLGFLAALIIIIAVTLVVTNHQYNRFATFTTGGLAILWVVAATHHAGRYWPRAATVVVNIMGVAICLLVCMAIDFAHKPVWEVYNSWKQNVTVVQNPNHSVALPQPGSGKFIVSPRHAPVQFYASGRENWESSGPFRVVYTVRGKLGGDFIYYPNRNPADKTVTRTVPTGSFVTFLPYKDQETKVWNIGSL